MRAMWSGAVSFGLVNIPVRLYSATEEHALDFHLLHKEDLSPVGYVKVCKEEGKEVKQSDIVKGYEYERGRYVVIEDEDFERASPRKTKTIDIVDFVCVDEIDSIYFEKPYYLEADRGADKAYSLLREALEKSKKVGVAKYVLRNREQLGVVKPMGDILVLDQIRFSQSIRKPEGLKVPEVKVEGRELDMAITLIDQLTEPFEPDHYHDTYSEEMLRVIHAKIAGKEPEPGEPAPAIPEVTDLVALLKASLDQQPKKAKREEKQKEKVA
ncbi:MAG TPA: Ku protein [Chloroflexota bacterium]|nr:Ku protein [Chloroflexota bacterium]